MTNPALSGIDVAILAGGLGTRLRPVLPDTPKILAPVGGRPFLEILLDHLQRCGARRVVLCLGHLASQVDEWLAAAAERPQEIVLSVEAERLGTAGALRLARPLLMSDPVLVMNGDTFCDTDYAALVSGYCPEGATLLCAHQPDASRYGAITVGDDGAVLTFNEKEPGPGRPGLINAGVYLFSGKVLDAIADGHARSLERDVLPHIAGMAAVRHDGAFIDIGLPETLKLAASVVGGAHAA